MSLITLMTQNQAFTKVQEEICKLIVFSNEVLRGTRVMDTLKKKK